MATFAQRLDNYERRRSRPAAWSQTVALFAAILLVTVALSHRFGGLDTVTTFWLLLLGLALVVVAIALALRGLYDLWEFGEKGGLQAVRGLFLSVLLLLPFFFVGVLAFTRPPIYDVSTDLDDPPAFENAILDRTEGMNPIVEISEDAGRLQLQAYPRVVARRYPVGAGRVFRAVAEVLRDREWTVLTSASSTGVAPIDDEGSALIAKPTTDAEGRPLRLPLPEFRPDPNASDEEVLEVQPVAPTGRDEAEESEVLEERYVEAVAISPITGFESDVVFRIVEEENGTLVDMRSVSRWGPHDLGANASLIVNFLGDLDAALQGVSR